MLEVFGNFVEWFGTIAILGAYGLTMFHAIAFQSRMFFIMNLAGALALVIGGTFKRHLWNNVIFYIIWAAITAIVFFNPLHWNI